MLWKAWSKIKELNHFLNLLPTYGYSANISELNYNTGLWEAVYFSMVEMTF
jgi:hypothetical protein